jgi:hypothetical protein
MLTRGARNPWVEQLSVRARNDVVLCCHVPFQFICGHWLHVFWLARFAVRIIDATGGLSYAGCVRKNAQILGSAAYVE